MARAIRVEFEGAVYHVTARGNERKPIYRDDRDRERFLETLEETVERFGLVIHTYCLMPNHDLCGAPHNRCYVKLRLMLSCSRRILIFPISRRHCFT